jgi:hypothetical protein
VVEDVIDADCPEKAIVFIDDWNGNHVVSGEIRSHFVE